MQICSPLQVGKEEWNNYWAMRGKKNLIRELCYKGEEKHGERERERERERDLRKRGDQS